MKQGKSRVRIGQEPKLKFITLDPAELKSDGVNPNKMTDEELDALKTSITRYGFIAPVLVNNEHVIVDGEQRWQASKELKLKQIPVIEINVKEVDRKILRQVMNKLRGKHDPLLDLEEFKKIYNEDGLKMLEELTFIPKQNIVNLIEKYDTKGFFLDDIDKSIFYGENINANDAVEIEINKIKPNKWNPTNLGNAGYALLKRSIKAIGILNPIVVRKKGKYYEIIDGENRWKIAKELGASFVQAKIIEVKNELEAKAISFSLNKIKGKLDSSKSTALVNEIRKGMNDKELQAWLGLDKKKLDRYLAFGDEGVFFETPTGLVVRQYTSGEYDEKRPSLIIIFNNAEDLNTVKTKLLSINQDLTKALLEICVEGGKK
jgi:ParB-like chromosome segregation protein Spo0J